MFLLKPYSADLFVDRQPEISLVTGILRQLRESGGQVTRNKAILFRGERGNGKTWLSLHLHRTVLKEFKVESLYLALYPLPKEYKDNLLENEWAIPETYQPEATCNELMQWVCQKLKIEYPNEPSIVELRRALIGGAEKDFKDSNFLVLILDSVFETDWNLLEMVESNFLAPLAEIPNVLFIMTGRGKPYPWISPALRMGIKEESLRGLPADKIGEFKIALAPDSLMGNNELADLTGGSPLVGYLLLQGGSLDAVADYLLEVVPPGLDRKRLREAFEALCVLEEFRESEMEVMVKAYYEAKKESMPPMPIRDLRDELLKTYLFRWEGGGFRVDASLRNVLRNYLKNNQKALWQQLNCAAYQIYAGFAGKYPQYKTEYENLAKPYKEILEFTHFWTECEKDVQNAPKA